MDTFEKIKHAIGDLDESEINILLKKFVLDNPTEEKARMAVTALQEGMAIVGERFEEGEYYIADLVYAGNLLTSLNDSLKQIIGKQENIASIGVIVLGTVHGDLHDIGKNIFKIMAESSGFEVHDIGIDQPVESFVKKVKEVKPDIVGLSGLLTLALDSMADTIHGFKQAGIRDGVKVIIGGNPVTKEICEQVGADAFTNSAAEGVKICNQWIENNK